jgi:multicomponent Na+:H+ antiporter subunit E
MLLTNILLALVWAAASGSFTVSNFVAGFFLGSLILAIAHWPTGGARYLSRVYKVAGFALFYLRELVLANLKVAYDVLTPGYHMRPAVIAIPLDAKTDAEIALLANLITLTPGTLSLDVSSDRRFLYIHAMYVGDVEAFRRSIKVGLERRVLEILR